MMPVSTSTFSDWIILSASCTAMSGLRWSSSMTTSISALPDCLTASMKPSRTSMPRPAPPPESVVIMPTLTGSAASGAARLSAQAARIADLSFIALFSRWIVVFFLRTP